MKYCPFCGATLMGSAVSFCSECGKPIPTMPRTQTEEPMNRQKKEKRRKNQPSKYDITPDPQDDGYDGYYDDVRPLDNGHEKERMDPELVKKIMMVAGGAAVLIILSMAAMLLL